MQRHKEMEQHRGPHTCMDPTHLHGPYAPACLRSRFLGALPRSCMRGPRIYLYKVSPNLIHFKAHLRGFHWGRGGGYKMDLGRHKRGQFFKEKMRRKGDWSGRLEIIGFVASHLAFFILLS